MKTTNSGRSVKKNVMLSISVQVVSLMVSTILNLVVPKFIPELQFAHWQTYVLYVGYVGVLHFGLLDGIVLRYSQYDYDELDKPRIRSQFKLLLLLNTVMSLITVGITFAIAKGVMRYIFLYIAIGIITTNLFTYTSYSFQITNRIREYAILVISQRAFYGVMTLVLLLFRVKNFYLYCIADLCGDVFGFIIGYFYNKDLYFGKSIPFKDAIKEFWANTSSGIMLLIANWSAILLVGSAKMIVQWHWDELTFGKVSFSFSISNLFLAFVTAISVVLFPSLKRMDKDKLPKIYMSIRNAVSLVLFLAMVFYYPGYFLLDLWLPKYHESLMYLGILMPIIVYTSKVSLLTNNYLKAYREEKKMLVINVISVIVASIIFAISAYVLNSLFILLVMIVLVIMLRSIVSEIVVMKIINIKMYKDFIIEAIMTLGFILSAKLFDPIIGFIIYSLLLLVYLFIYKETIKPYFKKMRRSS